MQIVLAYYDTFQYVVESYLKQIKNSLQSLSKQFDNDFLSRWQ